MNIEELMNVEVTSVSGHEQFLSKTAAAIFVITEEEILRSGATNIPDLLRMVPGAQVAQINASSWAVSIRWFNGRFSNKVLVTVDGRTVYVPSFGGVFYEVLDVPLEQISRIEVIRGPGGSVWGTNAVNGVINILTKKPPPPQIPPSSQVAAPPTVARHCCSKAANFAVSAISAFLLSIQPKAECPARRLSGGRRLAHPARRVSHRFCPRESELQRRFLSRFLEPPLFRPL
jgi:outer membrane cobalamin receptor